MTNAPWSGHMARAKPVAKPKRKPKPPSLPEWLLQSYMIAEWHKCEAEGMPLSAVGDMNAGRRSYQTAMQCKAMGLTSGEPDCRLYGYPARVLFVEVKTARGKLSDKQIERHAKLRALDHMVLVVAPSNEKDARRTARDIANRFCEGGFP